MQTNVFYFLLSPTQSSLLVMKHPADGSRECSPSHYRHGLHDRTPGIILLEISEDMFSHHEDGARLVSLTEI